MSTLVEQIAALPSWQRARVDRLRVDGRGRCDVEWIGMVPVADPAAELVEPVPAGVSVGAWVKPHPLVLQVDGDPEVELEDLAASGIVGPMTVERLTAPDEVRWRALAWEGFDGRVLAVEETSAAMAELLAADAEVRLARWRMRQAERALQAGVRETLQAGCSAALVGAGLGVSRARVYQMRDGRR